MSLLCTKKGDYIVTDTINYLWQLQSQMINNILIES